MISCICEHPVRNCQYPYCKLEFSYENEIFIKYEIWIATNIICLAWLLIRHQDGADIGVFIQTIVLHDICWFTGIELSPTILCFFNH